MTNPEEEYMQPGMGEEPVASAEFEDDSGEPEVPVPAAPVFDTDQLVEQVVAKLATRLPQAQQQYTPPPVDAGPPSWDTFPGTLDEYVTAHIAYSQKGQPQAIQQAMLAMQESQALANYAADIPQEVAAQAQVWFNNLPPEYMRPGVSEEIVAYALGKNVLAQRKNPKANAARAPRAVADSGVPSGGFTSAEDTTMRSYMKNAFPHLSDKEIAEMVRNNG